MATCSDRDEFSLVLVLHIIYKDEGYSDWKSWINDLVVIVLLFAPQCCANITMQNHRAMKIVNFTHVQTAKTRCSFRLSVNAGYEATPSLESAKD